METFRKIVWAAAAAGLVAGLFAAALHTLGTVPIILKAESYEEAAESAAQTPSPGQSATATPLPAAAAQSGHVWETAGWLERTAATVLADIVTAFGFALLLVAGYVLKGGAVDGRVGLFWGLAGFATFTVAPGLGLPPELPGSAAAPLLDRQIWWVLTAIATAAGLALLCFTRRAHWAIAAIALLVLPHLVGAPHPTGSKSLAPETLAHQYVAATFVTGLLFWSALGWLTGFFYGRLGKTAV